MIVGIDGGTLSVTDDRLKVGVYRVVYNLIRELALLDKKNEYRIYSFQPLDPEVLRMFGPKMRNIVITPQKAWFTLRLPIELTLHPVDVFLGVAQALPTVKARRIGFIYDLGFLYHPEAYSFNAGRLKKQTENLVKKSDHIITISEATKSDILREYPRVKPKISVVYPGADALFTPRGKIYKQDNPYILFVGSLNKTKNIPLALEAFAKFLQSSKKLYDFILVGGDYWPDNQIDNSIQQLQLGNRVKKVGFVSDKELAAYYRGATALIVTSLCEGFCLPVVEALASGVPIVAARSGSLPEVVGKAGLIVHPSASDIAQALIMLTSDKRNYKKLSAYAIKQAQNFSWHSFAQGVLSHIEP